MKVLIPQIYRFSNVSDGEDAIPFYSVYIKDDSLNTYANGIYKPSLFDFRIRNVYEFQYVDVFMLQ